MNYKDAVKWLRLGFDIRRNKWPMNLYCVDIYEENDIEHMKLNNMRKQQVTKLERNANDWSKS